MFWEDVTYTITGFAKAAQSIGVMFVKEEKRVVGLFEPLSLPHHDIKTFLIFIIIEEKSIVIEEVSLRTHVSSHY